MTLQWTENIAPLLKTGHNVLFEGQMRIAFIQEALALQGITDARILCVECDDATRICRLTRDRLQPELASDSMLGWSHYLHQEAVATECDILDTTHMSLEESVKAVLSLLGCCDQ